MIESVALSNFLSHRETTVELEEGVNVFIGNNGSGKSSVIDAITYALFGRHTRSGDRDLVRRGSSAGGASVTISVGGNRYRVERRLDSSGRLLSATLRQVSPVEQLLVAGERKQMGESVSERVSRIIGLDYDRLRVAAIIQQGELDSLLRYTPASFKELIDSIIGIERLDEAYRNMKDAIDIFRERLRGECMGKYDDRNYQQLLDDIKSVSSRAEELRKKMEEAARGVEEARAQLEEANRRLLELEPKRQARLRAEELRRVLNDYVSGVIKEMKGRAEELRTTSALALKQLRLASGLDASQKRLEEAEARAEELRKAIESLAAEAEEYRHVSERASAIESELEGIRGSLDELRKGVEGLEKELEGLSAVQAPSVEENIEERLKDLRAKRDRAIAQRGSLARKIDDYVMIEKNGRCPTCDSDARSINVQEKLATAQAQLKQVEEELKGLEAEIARLEELRDRAREAEESRRRAELIRRELEGKRAMLESLEKRKTELEAELSERRRRAEQIKDSPKRLELARKGFSEALGEAKGLQEAVESMRAARAWLEEKGISSEEDARRMEEEAERLLEAVKRASSPATLQDLGVDEHATALVGQVLELEGLSAGYSDEDYRRAQESRDGAMKRLNELETSAKHYQEAISELEEELKGLEGAREKVEEAMKHIKAFETIRDEVFNRDGAVATSFRSWAIREISRYASEYVRRFGVGITEVRLEESRRSVGLKCFTINGEVPVESLSGGEKVAVALALRFGMARLMGGGNIDFIILDEPTVYLDEERKRTLVGIISGFSAGQGPIRQMIIITHDREIFEGASVDAVFRFEKVNGVTEVQKS